MVNVAMQASPINMHIMKLKERERGSNIVMLRERKGENFYWFVVSRQVSFKGDLVTVSWFAGTESKEHWFYQVYLRCCFTSPIKSLFLMGEYYGPFYAVLFHMFIWKPSVMLVL